MPPDDPHIPPAPWTLRGDAVVGLKWVSSDVARRFVPPDARVVCMWPGRTLAILYFAHYRQSPVGEYHELIVAPSLVWRNGRMGFWISHIFVDSAASQVAGRTIWALPKQLASMQWRGGRIVATAPLLSLHATLATSRKPIRLPFVGAAMSKDGSQESWFAARGAARVGSLRARVECVDDIGLHELGFHGSMRLLACRDMRVTIGRPRR